MGEADIGPEGILVARSNGQPACSDRPTRCPSPPKVSSVWVRFLPDTRNPGAPANLPLTVEQTSRKRETECGQGVGLLRGWGGGDGMPQGVPHEA